MRVPSRTYRLAPSATVVDRAIDLEAWQAHVISHPFGLETIRRGTRVSGLRRWNQEGWDRLDPPVLDEDARIRATRVIRALRDGSRACGVHELETLETTAPTTESRIACYRCGPVLTAACAAETRAIAARYVAVVDQMLRALEDATVIRQQQLAVAIGRIRAADEMPTVGTLGVLRSKHVFAFGFRLNRPDGTRVELRAEDEAFFWRTTYRNPPRNLAGVRTHLRDHLTGADLSDELSGKALVPRPWWERNQPR